MGTMYRTSLNLGEAIKAHRNALRLEPDNSNALRDLACAQCHTHEFSGAAETRAVLLKARPKPMHGGAGRRVRPGGRRGHGRRG